MQTPRHGCYINDKNPNHSMVKTLIRPAVTEDFNILLEMDQASFSSGVAYNAAELAYFMRRPGAETLILEEDKQVMGFLILELRHTRRSGTIVTLDVRETHRRKGYGSQLLKRAEDIMFDYGAELYDLQVDVSNRAAIVFYKKHGFRTVRTLRRYYANGNDAYLMVKELQL